VTNLDESRKSSGRHVLQGVVEFFSSERDRASAGLELDCDFFKRERRWIRLAYELNNNCYSPSPRKRERCFLRVYQQAGKSSRAVSREDTKSGLFRFFRSNKKSKVSILTNANEWED
jgi:hypothetical protein